MLIEEKKEAKNNHNKLNAGGTTVGESFSVNILRRKRRYTKIELIQTNAWLVLSYLRQ